MWIDGFSQLALGNSGAKNIVMLPDGTGSGRVKAKDAPQTSSRIVVEVCLDLTEPDQAGRLLDPGRSGNVSLHPARWSWDPAGASFRQLRGGFALDPRATVSDRNLGEAYSS